MTGPEEERRLAALADLGVDPSPEERFDRITRLCTRLFGVSRAAVMLVGREQVQVKAAEGLPRADVPRADSFCSVTVTGESLLVVPDAAQDDRFAHLPVVAGTERLRFYAGAPLSTPSGERVGTLCLFDERPRTLTEPEAALLVELAGWVERELAADDELDRAADVQRGLLPRRPGEVPGYRLVGACVTSRQVGGDLFDWYPVGTATAVTVADVMGKGLPAALVMASLRAVLRAATRYRGVPTAVATASEALQSDFGDSGTFATLFHGVLEPDTGSLHFVDAGHGLALLVRADGSATRLAAGGLPVGVLPDASWRVGELSLLPGDTLVVHSDGLLDLHGDRAEVERRVVEAVTASRSADEVLEHLVSPVRRAALPDDVTALVLRRDA